MNRNILIAGGLVVGLVVGGVGTKLWLEKARQTPSFAQGGAKLPSGPMKIMSTGGDLLNDCKPFSSKSHPDRVITIDIPGTFDIDNLQPVIKVWAPNATWTGPDKSKPLADLPPSNWTPRTELDLNLNLADTSSSNKASMVLIQVNVADPNIKFRNDDYAVEAGNMSGGNSSKMFCKFAGGFQAKSVTFVASYFSDNNGSKPTFGSYNLGLVTGNGNPFEMPIFLDPEVENNG